MNEVLIKVSLIVGATFGIALIIIGSFMAIRASRELRKLEKQEAK